MLISNTLGQSSRPFLAFLFAVFVLSPTAPVVGQSDSSKRTVDPRKFGIKLRPGPVSYEPTRVTTTDQEGRAVVGKTHVKIGDSRIVLLPNGELVTRTKEEAQVTERPFKRVQSYKYAEKLVKGRFSGFKSKVSRHYIFVYNTSETFAVSAIRIMDSMFPGVMRYFQRRGMKVDRPEVPLVVLMFRTEREFQNHRRMPSGVIAYYHTLTNKVVLYEHSNRRRMDFHQTISTMAHEGAHQILHNIGVQKRLSVWPMWFAEGMAEYFAPTSAGKSMSWMGPGKVNKHRMMEVARYVKARGSGSGDMVKKTVSAARLTSTGYASAWSLTHYLATKKRSSFNKYLRAVSQLRPLEGGGTVVPPGVIPTNLKLFEEHVGSDLGSIEAKLIAHLKVIANRKDTIAESRPHYLVMVVYGKRARRKAKIFATRAKAESWRRRYSRSRGSRSFIRRFPDRTTAERFSLQWLMPKK